MKRIISIVATLLILSTISLTAFAKESSYVLGDVYFNADGKTMSNTFQKNLDDEKVTNVEDALQARLRYLQPDDKVRFVINLRNEYSKTSNWYMTHSIIDSLEEGTAKDGAYSYHLWYEGNATGKKLEIFNSKGVGGTDTTGLMEINDALKEDYTSKTGDKYFYLDRLAHGQGGQVFLEIELDGETQGNDYQDRLADLKMNFAVQVVNPNNTTTTTRTAPRTGYDHNLLPYYIAMIISGLLFLYFALDAYTDRLYKKGKGRV